MPSSFASDNSAGVHADVLHAIQEANVGHVPAYGDDPYTRSAEASFRHHFGEEARVYFVYGGTGANILGLKAVTESYHAVLCAESAHINVDECGAPERHLGCKLIAIPTTNGKLCPEDIQPHLKGFGDPHHAQPKVISITQATELGTVYQPEEIRALADLAHQNDMVLHMDGARLSNAAASLNLGLSALTRDVGVDVLSFGGAKSGLLFGEAVLFFAADAALDRVPFLRKQSMQLASKMRFIAAQFQALLTDDLWCRNAGHANRMAHLLVKRVEVIDGVKVTQPAESNAVFARIPAAAIAPLQDRYFFYMWDAANFEVRWMTAFDTTEEDVEDFAMAIREELGRIA
jgi:threonine aldolase